MDFFSGSNPNLISNKSLKNMEKLIKVNNPVQEISITDTFGSFYGNFIEPNLFIIGIIVILILFLLYKYYTKEEQNDTFENLSDRDLFKENLLDQYLLDKNSQQSSFKYTDTNFNPDYIPNDYTDANSDIIDMNYINNFEDNYTTYPEFSAQPYNSI